MNKQLLLKEIKKRKERKMGHQVIYIFFEINKQNKCKYGNKSINNS